MPLYEYECAACHKRTEKIQKFSDAELTMCPHCGGALQRTITAPAVHFAGGGWYKDGYGSAKPSAPSESGSPESAAPAAPTPAAAEASAGAATPVAAPAATAPATAPAASPSKPETKP